MTKNTILIPVDRVEFSLQILPCIRRFLNPTENRLLLLHVEKEPETIHINPAGFDHIDIYVDESEAALRTLFADQLLPTVRALEKLGFEVTTEVEFGEPLQAIQRCAAEKEVALVAMATHGRTGLNRVLHGSVAEQVLHHIDIPILLFHPKEANGLSTDGKVTH